MTTITSESVIIPPRTFSDECDRWKFVDGANCYAFALSIEIDRRLLPGVIAGVLLNKKSLEPYSDAELISYVAMDVQHLGMTIRESSRDEKVTTPNAWKIAGMNCEEDDRNYDFHFLRQNPLTGEWYQKFPRKQHPTRQDEREKIITDPATACYEFNYHLVGYYVISKLV